MMKMVQSEIEMHQMAHVHFAIKNLHVKTKVWDQQNLLQPFSSKEHLFARYEFSRRPTIKKIFRWWKVPMV